MQNREQCPNCDNYNLILTLGNGVRICKSCKDPLPTIERECLKCDLEFKAINKFKRVCPACTPKIEGIVLYGMGRD